MTAFVALVALILSLLFPVQLELGTALYCPTPTTCEESK